MINWQALPEFTHATYPFSITFDFAEIKYCWHSIRQQSRAYQTLFVRKTLFLKMNGTQTTVSGRLPIDPFRGFHPFLIEIAAMSGKSAKNVFYVNVTINFTVRVQPT